MMATVFADVKPNMRIVKEEVPCTDSILFARMLLSYDGSRLDLRSSACDREVSNGGRGDSTCE